MSSIGFSRASACLELSEPSQFLTKHLKTLQFSGIPTKFTVAAFEFEETRY